MAIPSEHKEISNDACILKEKCISFEKHVLKDLCLWGIGRLPGFGFVASKVECLLF